MRKNVILKFSAGITAFLLILSLFSVVNSFLCNSVLANTAKGKALFQNL
mgnify:CR=1 FL=1|jgi:hypothetical protein